MEHVKWALMRINDAKVIADVLAQLFKVTEVKIFESEIVDDNKNVICDIWVLEFDIDESDLKILKRVMKLEDINGYLMSVGA